MCEAPKVFEDYAMDRNNGILEAMGSRIISPLDAEGKAIIPTISTV